jgi:aminopeptidase N
MFLRLLFFILFLSAMNIFPQTPAIEPGVSQTLAKWRAANYSDVRYKLNLTLEKMSPTLKGTIEISLKTNADRIVLDWRKIRGKENLSTVSNVSINGKSAKFEEVNEHLVFAENLTKGENVIKLDFTSPIATSGAAVTRYIDKEDGAEYVYSLFVPSDASTAFPCFDQPDLKARFQLNVTVPEYWKVVSNTDGIGIHSGHRNRQRANKQANTIYYSFYETKPISTYVFAFAAGDFVEFVEEKPTTIDNLALTLQSFLEETLRENSIVYVRKSQAQKFKQHSAEVFRLNREAVKYLETYFDYKFPFPKYDLVLIPEFPFRGMEHAGATFLREESIIFPTEPTANDFISRANVIFHEAAHQWFGDTVTMRWFDDLWLKEGFAEFMAYKTLEKVLPEYNAWKIFYERNKQLAYLTDATKGTTPIYQEIPNLSAAKSAYGNIVYRKAPSFLKQAEFYLGADKFQTAVRAFLKKHEFRNAEWTDLVREFETASNQNLKDWANVWVKTPGLPIIRPEAIERIEIWDDADNKYYRYVTWQRNGFGNLGRNNLWKMKMKTLFLFSDGTKEVRISEFDNEEPKTDMVMNNVMIGGISNKVILGIKKTETKEPIYSFPNYQDYGYGIFLLDEKSRDYVLKNIQNETDDFLRAMMWGALWDSVRETELDPETYVELVARNINVETDESTIQTLLNRVSTAMNYYLSDKQREQLTPQIERLLLRSILDAKTAGQKITFFRAYLNIASSKQSQITLERFLGGVGKPAKLETIGDVNALMLTVELPALKTKDKFDIVTKLLILGYEDAPNLLAKLEKMETSDEAKRYAYAARAGIATAENKAKFWNEFVGNKELSESWIESAFVSFNAPRHSELTLPYLEKSLAELPNLKRNRKIFFVNGWLAAFIGGQRSEQALNIVNKFLADNPNLDKDLRLKILEASDNLERAVRIRNKFK